MHPLIPYLCFVYLQSSSISKPSCYLCLFANLVVRHLFVPSLSSKHLVPLAQVPASSQNISAAPNILPKRTTAPIPLFSNILQTKTPPKPNVHYCSSCHQYGTFVKNFNTIDSLCDRKRTISQLQACTATSFINRSRQPLTLWELFWSGWQAEGASRATCGRRFKRENGIWWQSAATCRLDGNVEKDYCFATPGFHLSRRLGWMFIEVRSRTSPSRWETSLRSPPRQEYFAPGGPMSGKMSKDISPGRLRYPSAPTPIISGIMWRWGWIGMWSRRRWSKAFGWILWELFWKSYLMCE